MSMIPHECENQCQCDECQGIHWNLPTPKPFTKKDKRMILNLAKSARKYTDSIILNVLMEKNK